MKECPLCGETMRLSVRELEEPAASGQTGIRTVREWICPDCDYFEDVEAGEG